MRKVPKDFAKVVDSQNCVKRPYKIDIILASQTGGCLFLYESSAENPGAFCATFIQQ